MESTVKDVATIHSTPIIHNTQDTHHVHEPKEHDPSSYRLGLHQCTVT
jgi:hypothetical protein